MDILELYRENKTALRNYFKEKTLESVLDNIKNATLSSNLKFRSDIGYPLERTNITDKLERNFVDKIDRIAPEHAQKFYLYQHSIVNKYKNDVFGYIFAYELPFFRDRGSGAIDLVAYDDVNNVLNLIELKNCKMGVGDLAKEDSNESLIRAILEIETYSKFVEEIIKKEKGNEILLGEVRKKLKEDFELDVSEQKMRDCKIQKNLLIPRSLYEYSRSINEEEKEILVKLPQDIMIYEISLKNPDFDVAQKIGDVAEKKEMIFNIELIKEE